MIDPRLRKLARLLVRYCVRVRPGDQVGIMPYGSVASSLPLQAELVREVLESGGQTYPYVLAPLADEFGHVFYSAATDEGSHRLGEFGIGTNSAIKIFTKNMLFDEKIGGTIHVAAGAGFAETGAVNDSAIHWDFLCDMSEGGQITVDDQPFYDSGRFLV